ncbi:MAG: leucyl aminopeptidase family protein [Rickettsiales bacterium]
MWAVAHLPDALPPGNYHLDFGFHPVLKNKPESIAGMAAGWGLACYQFQHFKKSTKNWAKLYVPAKHLPEVERLVSATHHARDLINLPANIMTPLALADEIKATGKKFGAKVSVIAGDDLLKKSYPSIHAVGRASVNPPCLTDLTWGSPSHPKVTLVGKGVCFDSGGLDIKNAANMKLMKKDMGGAACLLALAEMIMGAKLPVRLRLLVPAVENSISGNAYRPMDVITTRKGITIEIGDTDAEGRVILCDALTEADSEKPDMLIDCATLTGAARVALGTDIPAFFTDDDQFADSIYAASKRYDDPLWRLPLHMPYDDMIQSKIADISTIADSGYAGAIIGGLFLKHFVTNTKTWVHIDMMAWNIKNRPGRPIGAEAMAIRALYGVIRQRFA